MKKLNDSTSHCAKHDKSLAKVLFSRRYFAKGLLAAGVSGAGAVLLPATWVKPIVERVILPVHAQTTPEPPPPPPIVPPRFRFELAAVFTGQQVSLSQDGFRGVLTLRPGLAIPPEICQQNFAFVGTGYNISVTGDRPAGDVSITVMGKAENYTPGLTECSGVEMLALVDGPQNGCFATDTPLPYTLSAGADFVAYQGNAPVAYKVRPCLQGCNNVADGFAGSITISDNAGVIPTLTIDVMMQGGCI